MKEIVAALPQALSNVFLPHYKEDMLRGALVGVAFRSGWRIAEPRPANAKTIQAGQAAVYILSWNHGSIVSTQSTVANRAGTKPDTRLISPAGDYYTCELKCGMTGSASESNSNSTKVADDIDMVASRQRDLFFGLFDGDMLDRIQGRLSSAGRGAEINSLLGGVTLSGLHKGKQRSDITSAWQRTSLRATVIPIVCQAGIPLALVLVRDASATF